MDSMRNVVIKLGDVPAMRWVASQMDLYCAPSTHSGTEVKFCKGVGKQAKRRGRKAAEGRYWRRASCYFKGLVNHAS